MKASLAVISLFSAVTFALPASAAPLIPIPVHIDSLTNPSGTAFMTVSASPSKNYVTSFFYALVTGINKPFEYSFDFTLPLTGSGKGSLTTSSNSIDITQIVVNGHAFAVAPSLTGQSINIANFFPIVANTPNSIEVFGTTGPTNFGSIFSGNATFSAVPEPATWATFLLGFGCMGLALRRKARGKFQTV